MRVPPSLPVFRAAERGTGGLGSAIRQSCLLSSPQPDTRGNFLDRIVANLDPETCFRFAPQRELELGAEQGEGHRFEITGNRPATIRLHAFKDGRARCFRFGALRGRPDERDDRRPIAIELRPARQRSGLIGRRQGFFQPRNAPFDGLRGPETTLFGAARFPGILDGFRVLFSRRAGHDGSSPLAESMAERCAMSIRSSGRPDLRFMSIRS